MVRAVLTWYFGPRVLTPVVLTCVDLACIVVTRIFFRSRKLPSVQRICIVFDSIHNLNN